MHNIRVTDIIIPLESYPHFTREVTLQQAIQEMEKVQIVSKDRKSLPRVALVFGKDQHELLGLVRRRDILRGLLPDFLMPKTLEHSRQPFDVQADPNLTEISTERLIKIMREQAKRQVSEVMLPIKATIELDDTIIKAIHLMVS
ncbi:MAG: CBS domain-containing protein, partial [Candidatus Riflebacteria bacterium]|nr:CBS domain-containing protein [Candidatus Riflebacteria bacterium]